MLADQVNIHCWHEYQPAYYWLKYRVKLNHNNIGYGVSATFDRNHSHRMNQAKPALISKYRVDKTQLYVPCNTMQENQIMGCQGKWSKSTKSELGCHPDWWK